MKYPYGVAMIRKQSVVMYFVVVCCAVCGCVSMPSAMTVLSTKHDAGILGSKMTLVKKNASITRSIPVFLVPIGTVLDYESVENLLQQYDGDLVTNVTIKTRTTIVILFGSITVEVTGDVWKLADKASLDTEYGPDRAANVYPGGRP